jgi:hypothetical protein
LAGDGPATGKPIEDPAVADRANPRWDETTAQRPGAQSLANPDGSSNVLPPKDPQVPMPPPEERSRGTAQDQAARPLDPEVGRDNIREGRGGGAPNPALAEGGDNG